jgi:hypothetical protein
MCPVASSFSGHGNFVDLDALVLTPFFFDINVLYDLVLFSVDHGDRVAIGVGYEKILGVKQQSSRMQPNRN